MSARLPLACMLLLAAVKPANAAFDCVSIYNDLSQTQATALAMQNDDLIKFYESAISIINERIEREGRSAAYNEEIIKEEFGQKIQFCKTEGTIDSSRKRPIVYIVPYGCRKDDPIALLKKKLLGFRELEANIKKEALEMGLKNGIYTKNQSEALAKIQDRYNECIEIVR